MRWLCCMALAGSLAGCVGRAVPDPVVAIPIVSPAPVAPTPTNAGLSPAATLWHLRTGLNVAALACPAPELVAEYNALLSARADVLGRAEAAYRAEYAAAGGDWRDRYDDDQTRLYNFWSQGHGRAALCAAAQDGLRALAGADAATLPEVAGAALARLDQAFAPPWLTVDQQVLDGPGRVMVAAR